MQQEFAALHAPVANYTWEASAVLGRLAEQTARIPLNFQRPIEIVGMRASVIQGSEVGGGLRVPTAEDILALIDINQEERLTNRLEQTAAAGGDVSLVTLAALSVQTPRLIRKVVRAPTPVIGVQFRWKRPANPGAIYEDAHVSLAFYINYLD